MALLIIAPGSAATSGISSGNITTISAASVSTGATLSDSNAITAISNSVTGTDSEKATRRRSAIALFFSNNSNTANFKLPLATLNLSSTFTDRINSNINTIFAVKAGETVDTSALDSTEAVYVPLENDESITLFDGTITKVISKANDQYTLSSEDTLTYNELNSSASNFNFDNPPTGYFVDDDYLSSDGRITYFGGVEDGDEEDSGSICFPKGTLVQTDQGEIAIEKITNNNTIDGENVVKIVKKLNSDDSLVLIKRNAFRNNIPSRNTFITKGHSIMINGKLIKAKKLVNNKSIAIKSRPLYEPIYNVLLNKHHIMYVNDMVVETLHPKY